MRARSIRAFAAAGVFALGAAAYGLAALAQEPAITPASAFSTDELVAQPREEWITNGGTTFNQRYSPLDQINRETIGDLKAVWRVSLDGSGMGPGFSQEAQPLVHDGVIYIAAGNDDVFAIDVETGERLWKYEAGMDLETVKVCCGWLSRGVGLGDGKIFVGQLDATLVALDQTTGEQLWKTQVVEPDNRYAITSAPLYYDGMVITGVAGGEYGIRGRVDAYSADTGELIWRFYTIPGPGELGHETWPQGTDAWEGGGAPVWQTPAVDPELGLIYFSTGNSWPDYDGSGRAGDNLFTVSVLALDVRTGEYRWHFQQVRHDIWDYDSPNPVILFDAEYPDENGRSVPRRGLASASKSGYLYILDRETGEPLTPVDDVPVPQEPTQATAATQPIPRGDRLVPDYIDAVGEDYPGLLQNWGRAFTPTSAANPTSYAPLSGVNWHPSSYDPATNRMFFCASDGSGGGAPAPQGVEKPTRRFLVAMDLTDHSAVWRRVLKSRCTGSTTTAGGLVFTGMSDGRLLAADSDTGQRIWDFQTDGGVNGGITVFEHEGEQMIAVLAGGGLFGGKTNDGLWLFSLNGTIDSMPPGSADPAAAPVAQLALVTDGSSLGVPDGRVADLAHGEEIYRTVCQACHGENGEGAHEGGAPLKGTDLTLADIVHTARDGRPNTAMASFRDLYTADELHDVASFIKDVIMAEPD